jgi:hypothetical protein
MNAALADLLEDAVVEGGTLEDAVADAGNFAQPAALNLSTGMTPPGHVQDEPDNLVEAMHPLSGQREPLSLRFPSEPSGRVGHPEVPGETPALYLPELRPFSLRGMLMHAMLSYRVSSEGVGTSGNGFVKDLYDELLRLSVNDRNADLHLPFSGLGKFPHFLNQPPGASSSHREKQVSLVG